MTTIFKVFSIYLKYIFHLSKKFLLNKIRPLQNNTLLLCKSLIIPTLTLHYLKIYKATNPAIVIKLDAIKNPNIVSIFLFDFILLAAILVNSSSI